jgi:hypothetical protein
MDDEKERIKAAATDLRALARKAKGRERGSLLDNAVALEVIIRHNYDGGIPGPVSEPSLSVVRKYRLEHLIRHRPNRRDVFSRSA